MDEANLQSMLSLDGAVVLGAHVTEVRWDEALSQDTTCVVELISTEPLELDGLVGQSASLHIPTAEGVTRDVHGVIAGASIQLSPSSEVETTARLDIVPRLSLARVGSTCRIFQELSVPDIVTKVLCEANPESGSAAVLPAAGLEHATSATYEVQDYVVQHNESDYDFVSRLLADEGIGLIVRQDLDDEKIVLFDDTNAFLEVAELPEILFSHADGVRGSRVVELVERHESRPDAAVLRDHDYTQAATDLTSRHEAEATTGREVYSHPGGYDDPGRGARLVQRLLERSRVGARVLSGKSTCPHFEAGRKTRIDGHPRLDMNLEVVLTRVRHTWRRRPPPGEEGYVNEFEAIPLEVPFRPEAREAPWIGGQHLAFVTGASGQELHGSERGEVKVRFPWDRSGVLDDKSSTWARVGQLALGGPMIVPRVGFEVMVDYELGSLDRPFVVGHVYNGEAMPPYELPGGASISSFQTATTEGGAGANELRFEDRGGGEQIMFNASYDYVSSVENDASSNVIANESTTTGGSSSLAVGANQTTNVVGARSLSVGGNQNVNIEADYNQGTTGAWDVTVGNRKDTVGGDLTESVTGTLSREIGGLQNVTAIGGFTRTIAGDSSVTVGGAWIEMTAASRATTCASRIESVGALKMIKAKTMAVDAGAAYGMNAASETVKCGGNRVDKATGAVGINAGGGLSIKADNINVTAESKIVLNVGGSQIVITAGGVKMKSPKVDLGKVKEIPSDSHKSN